MYKDVEILQQEIQLEKDECCIVFDFGCYFPYANVDELTFNFSLGMEEVDDYKLNHRYLNKNWYTISKKYGRKTSKVGYPYVTKLNEQTPMLLCLNIGLNEEKVSLVFPVLTNMTKDKPYCVLSLHYNFEESSFCLESQEKLEDTHGWRTHSWSNKDIEEDKDSITINTVLSTPQRLTEDGHTLIYKDIIEPCPSTPDELFLFL